MQAKENLRKSFTTAFAAVSLTVGAVGVAMSAPPPSSKGRPLTPGEVEMVKIFGEEINPAIVRLHAGPNKMSGSSIVLGEAFNTTTVALYGHPFLSLDYSKEEDATNWGLFYHELTHTWQYQGGWSQTKGHCPGGYRYRLKPDASFGDYCSEAQGAIVEDYSRRYLKPKSAPSNWYVTMCGKDTPEHDAMLLKIVETRFPAAREMRAKLGRGEVLPDAVSRPPGAPPCPSPTDPDIDGGKETPVGKKGQPVYFCETLAYAFKNIHGIAFTAGLPAWPGFDAVLDKKEPTCKVSIWGTSLAVLGASDFANGQIKAKTMGSLAQDIVKYTPHGIIDPVKNNLSAIFDNLVDKQKAEIKALYEIKTKEQAERIVKALETQLAEDPSLPANSRGFVEEKVRIVKEMLRKLGGKVPAGPTQPIAGPTTGPTTGPDAGGTGKPAKPVDGGKPGDGKGGDGKGGAGKGGDGKGADAKPAGDKPTGGKQDGSAPQQPPKPTGGKAPVQPQPQPGGGNHGADNNIKDLLDSAFGKGKAGPAAPAKAVRP